MWNQTFTDGDAGKTALFHSLLPHVHEIPQPDYTRRDSTSLGIMRTLTRIDRILINLPMAEARDFHCYSHVFENLGNPFIPSEQAAVRLVIQKPTNRRHQSKRFPCWMSRHLVCCFLLQLTTDILPTRLARSQISKLFLKKGHKTDCSRALTEDT